MSYWVIQSIPSVGLFFTADTRTTADFNDGKGQVYCDGAKKVFYFHNADNTKKGAICFAGTNITRSADNKIYAVQNVISSIMSDDRFLQFLDTNKCNIAKNIYQYICQYVRISMADTLFPRDSNKNISMEDILRTECAIGIGLIDGTNISLYAYGFMDNHGVSSYAEHINESILIASNKNYLNIPSQQSPIIPNQVLNYQKKIVDDFKGADENKDMATMISDDYDKLYFPINGEPSGAIMPNKVNDIRDKDNYSSIVLDTLTSPQSQNNVTN